MKISVETFQLDHGETISSKEMEILPVSCKKEIEDIFHRVINSSEIQDEMRQNNTASVSLKVLEGKLIYQIEGSNTYRVVQDEKIKKAFLKASKNIRKFLHNVGALQEKKLNVSTVDKNILETSPTNVTKVSKDVLKKMKTSDSEWSLWAIFVCIGMQSIQKFFKFFGIDWKIKFIPKGVLDIFGYLIGFFGILNGLEIKSDSNKIGDIEGRSEGKQEILSNLLAYLGIMLKVFSDTFAVAIGSLAASALITVSTCIFIIVIISVTAKYISLALKAKLFQRKLSQYTNNKKLTEQQKMIAALKFLKNKVTITPEEANKILVKIRKENPTLKDYEIEELVHVEITKKLLTKIKRFERRAGSNVTNYLQQNVDEILKDPTNPENIEKAKKILEIVTSDNELNIKENKGYAFSAILEAVELLSWCVGCMALSFIAGGFSTAIVVILIGLYLYRKYIKKQNKLEAVELNKKLDLLANPAV